MTDIKRFTVPVEFTIKQDVIFPLEGSGSWSDEKYGDTSYGFGVAGNKFAVYLPGGKAVTLQVTDMVHIGLDAVKEIEA